MVKARKTVTSDAASVRKGKAAGPPFLLIDHMNMQPSTLPKVFPFTPSYLFTDVDDTLTWQGRLPVETLAALERLQQAGIQVVPVTGGCSGWCDCMLRTWPIDTIIGENGAVSMWLDERGRLVRHYALADDERKSHQERLAAIASQVREQVPEVELSLDTVFRLTDIAFDIGQQQHLPQQTIDKIIAICREMGASAKASSIHVNVWFGDVSKATAASALLQQRGMAMNRAIFIGDSANDESMFSQFDVTVGVANIKKFLPQLPKKPKYITERHGGFGFVELAEALLASVVDTR